MGSRENLIHSLRCLPQVCSATFPRAFMPTCVSSPGPLLRIVFGAQPARDLAKRNVPCLGQPIFMSRRLA